jgi:YD repeat-containing protein
MLDYNGLDDRVSQVSTTLGLSTTTRYVYDPDGRVIGEYGATATDVKAEYLWQSAEVGAGGIFGGDDGTGGYAPIGVATAPLGGVAALYWVHSNHLGVPLATTDAGGNAVTPSGYTQLAYPGQMSDFGGAALMNDAFPKAKALLGDTEHRAVPGAREDAQDMMPTGSLRHSQSERSRPAYPKNQTVKSISRTTRSSTDSDTKSRLCSAGSKTGDLSTPVSTDAPTPSCPQSASPQPSSFASINES